MWSKQTLWLMDDTYLELHPGCLGDWVLVDGRAPDHKLAGPFLKLEQGMAAAERLIVRSPQYRKEVLR